MANLDNNMGDFFRKKLNEGSGEEQWDRPDATLRDQLLSDINSKPSVITFNRYWPAAAILVLFFSWGYAANLHFKIKKQKLALKTQQDSILQQGQIITELQSNQQSKSTTNCQAAQEKAKKEVLALKEALAVVKKTQARSQEQQQLLKQKHLQATTAVKDLQLAFTQSQLALQTTKTELDQIKKEIKLPTTTEDKNEPTKGVEQRKAMEHFAEKNTTNSTSNKDKTEELIVQEENNNPLPKENKIRVEIPAPNFDALAKIETQIPAKKHALNTTDISPEPIIKLKKMRPTFEIGLQSGLAQMGISSYRESNNSEFISESHINNQAYGHKHNLQFALALNKDRSWWVESGLQYSRLYLEQEIDLNTLYNEAREYSLASGELANDINLEIYTAYSARNYNLQIRMPAVNTIDDADVLLIEAGENINFQRFQIPLGLAYQFGQERLKWRIHGGTAWNIVSTESYGLGVDLEAGSENLEIAVTSVDIDNSFNQHLSIYSGFSGQYEISKQWQATFGYQLAYNLNEQLLDSYEMRNSFNHNFQVGLSYQF